MESGAVNSNQGPYGMLAWQGCFTYYTTMGSKCHASLLGRLLLLLGNRFFFPIYTAEGQWVETASSDTNNNPLNDQAL